MTLQELQKKYKGKYVEVGRIYNYQGKYYSYTVYGAYDTIRENTTLAEDLETPYAYTR